jgi:hypothetical protein
MGIYALVAFFFVKKKDFFWTGIMWALAFFAKQTAIWFLIPIVYVVYKNKDSNKILKEFIRGSFLIFALFFVLALVLGILPDYIYWAYEFGVTKLPLSVGQIHSPGIKQMLAGLLPFFIGFLAFSKTYEKKFDVSLWMFAGMLGAYPRFELFHFQPAVPFLSLFLGSILANFNKTKKVIKNILIVYLLGSLYLFSTFLYRNWGKQTRFYEPEVYKVAEYIKNEVDENEKIFILNYWDHLYVLTDTIPATKPWVPHLPWYMELPGIQEEIVDDLKRTLPTTIAIGEYSDIGLSSYKPEQITIFLNENYQIVENVGGVNILNLR